MAAKPVQPANLAAKLAELTKPAGEIGESLLASATYDGDTRKAVLKFYDQEAGRFWLWEDNTGHRPYCFTRLTMDELEVIRSRKDVIEITEEERLDLLNDRKARLRKIVTTDPLAVGGGNDSIRDIIRAWEADIKYYENYTYDLGLRMGTYYRVSQGKIVPVKHDVPERVTHSLEEVTRRNPAEFQPYLKEWAELLGEPLSDFRRVAMDIEVANEAGRLPDTDDPKQPVIAVSFVNDREKVVYLLRGNREAGGLDGSSFDYAVFDDEADLLRAVMSKMMDYPVLVTFNGDDFDLRYLQHRAELLGIREEENPIQLERVAASLKHGIHIDLYQFFRNRSIQVYAFSNKYTEHTLNGISEALLNRSKIEFEGEIGDLPLEELAKYCMNDSQLTYDLTSIGGSVVMKLLLVISRIGKMPMNDVSRLGVSNWIRSMLFYEHRKIGALIPRQDELTEKGGASSQAIIKGKKYKGGFVIEPKPGAYFDVSVLDFASLYPSLIKVHNLSYETVNCTHPECRSNRIPDTSSWVCTKRKGIVSLVTGSLRDLRVAHYKPLTKDRTLPAEDRELYNVVTQGLKVFLNACFTGDTYVVTPDGIRNIKEMRVGDQVINVNPDTLKAEIDRVVEVQAFPYSGDLVHFRDSRFVDLMVTPNHRMLTVDHRKSSKSHALFRTAEEVCGLTNMAIPKLAAGIDTPTVPRRISLLETAKLLDAYANFYPEGGTRLINWFRKLPDDQQRKIREFGRAHKYWSQKRKRLESHYRVPARNLTEEDIDAIEEAGGTVLLGQLGGTKIPARYDATDLASLCGWFVSEGSPHVTEEKAYPNGNFRGRTASLTIAQGYGKGDPNGVSFRREIRQLLDKMVLPHVEDRDDNRYFQVTNSILFEWIASRCYDQRARAHDASTKRIPRFVYGHSKTMESFLETLYKGDGSRRQVNYTTASRGLAEDLIVLTAMLGMKAKMKYDGEVFRVVFKNVSSKLTYAGREIRKQVERVPFDGLVYCVTTEKNHTVIAGRNGRFVHVGQSYGVLGFETFAFYCLPVAEGTAALGRDAITRTIAKCKELGIEVLYGDSITGERCVALLDPSGIFRIMPVGELFDGLGRYETRPDGKEETHPANWQALSVNPETGRAAFKPILAVIRHKNRKRIFRVRERWGVTRVTEDHSLLARAGTGLVFAKPTALKGLETVRVMQIPELRPIEELDIYQEIRDVTFESVYKKREKTSTVKRDENWVWFGWTNRRTPIRMKRRYRVGTPEFDALIDLLAAYVPEGSSSTPATTQTRIGASISNSDTDWLAHLRDCYLSLFDGARTTIVRSSPGQRNLFYPTATGMMETLYEDRTYKLQMMNQISAVVFKTLGGQGSKGKKIPSFVFHLPREYKLRFLSGLVKGDGSRWVSDAYSQEYAEKNFRYESSSLQLISGLSLLLNSLGIGHTVNYRPAKDTYSISTSSQYNSRETLRVTEESYSGYVYDLSVADYHTFVDACGGIVLKNTDSLFLRSPSKEQVSAVTRWADTDLGIELDLDKSYRYVAFSSRKKNYFGVFPDGTVDIKGLTGKKSQTPEYLKKVFYETLDILSRVQNPEDFERARKSTRELLTGMISSIKGKKVPVQDLAFTVMMGKPTDKYNGTTPQHVRAAMQLEERGEEIKAGEIIAYVKTKNPPYVKPAKLARPDEVDADKYIEYAHSMFDQLLDALDFSFDEIMGATTLDLFWS